MNHGNRFNLWFSQIIFEAERGRSVTGEIGLDNVVLISGACTDDKTIIF